MTTRWVVIGASLAAATLLQPAFAWSLQPSWALGLLSTMAAELVTGRETAFAFATAAGVPPLWIAATSMLQNLAVAALIVPGFHNALDFVRTRSPKWGRILVGVHEGAQSQVHQGRNAWALLGFMLLPFLANGAVIAGLIGILAGLSHARLAAVLLAGVTITSLGWAFAYVWIADALSGLHPALVWLPAVLAAALVLVWGWNAAQRLPPQTRVR